MTSIVHRTGLGRRPSPTSSRPDVDASRRTVTLALSACAALLASPLAAESTVPVELAFAGEFAGQPFDCAARFENVGSSAASVTVADFRLYVSRVRLLDESGNETPLALDEDGRWQGEGVALLDFEDASGHCANGTAPVNTTVRGRAPAGDYTGVAFDIGVPFDRNHGDPTLAGSPLNLTALFWNWRGGYRFLRVDLANVSGPTVPKAGAMDTKHGDAASDEATGTIGDGSTKKAAKHGASHGTGQRGGWALHIGSTGCTAPTPTTAPDACVAPNRIEIVLPDFDPKAGTIVIDPALALANVDVAGNTPDTAPGCMSSPDDPECAAVLDALGLGTDGAMQTIVRAR